MQMDYIPFHFIGEPIEVVFDQAPVLEKKPGCPDRFIWKETTYTIVEIRSEWHDYQRRGRMARNMQPKHAKVASRHGSWGVGQDYYRVRTSDGHIFDIYYDRAPTDVDHRKGSWFLDKELVAK
jgi:hypothetical protein